MVKRIDNAFDHNGNVFCLLSTRTISVKIGLFSQEINFITEFSGSNFLLPTFLTGSKWDFQVANLLLATTLQRRYNAGDGSHKIEPRYK